MIIFATSEIGRMPKPQPHIATQRILHDPVHFIAFGFGTGLAPVAPGTFGTLAALPIFAVISGFGTPIYLIVCLALFGIGVAIAGRSARDLGLEDPSGIVIDEIIGFLVTLAAAPPSWTAVMLGFVLFRLFDIVKPWPISVLDRQVKGGLGIMLDDLVAGMAAGLSLHWLLPWAQRLIAGA